ncbi:MAG: CDP-diacylglycerol--glycerol-3-phosphate 3-phosphatidyltransferase [Brevinematales bacterium]|nr:CDP-diacylglycerol--glycerol-3-phosphate 3-phosphatidyltransferase [Brevinematales bacterium]
MNFKLNIPNILTISRALIVPIICYFLYFDGLVNIIIAILLLTFASLTDTFDGMIARKFNQTSEFGAFFDPLADKILVWGIYIGFLLKPFFYNMLPFVLIIILRDLFVTFLRFYSKNKNVEFKTSFLAKTKTAVQMIFAFVLMFFILITHIIKLIFKIDTFNYQTIWHAFLPRAGEAIVNIPFILMIFVSIFTLWTGIDYLLQYLKLRRKT